MDVLLATDLPPGELEAWKAALCGALPEARWWTRDDPIDAAAIEVAVVANPPPGQLTGLPNLRLVQSLWAGVDRLLADPTLPADVPIARMVDPAMTAAMVQTALWATLALHRGFFAYAHQQREGVWHQHAQRRANEVNVLVLGRGEMGSAVARALAAQGYRVRSWSRGRALEPELATSEIVINLLPLTPSTRGLVDRRFLGALSRGAAIVNLARGAHVVDADLVDALDRGHVAHAVLDVFHVEPLPQEHPYWRHPRVTLLPHAAALTDARSAAAVAAENLRALRDGRPVRHLVDRTRGY